MVKNLRHLWGLWKFLNGKKTNIAATINTVVMWVAIQGWFDQQTMTTIATVATIWFGVGAGHKVQKKMTEVKKEMETTLRL